MLRLLVVVPAVILALAVVAAPQGGAIPPQGKGPSTVAIVSMSSRFGFAHGCAVSDHLILTAAHVVNPFESNGNESSWGSRFETEDGVVGYALPVVVDRTADWAIEQTSAPLTAWAVPAAKVPQPGDRVWWVGYNWERRKDVARRDVHTARGIRAIAGQLWLDETVVAGASGSCVLNAAGELVGVIWGSMGMDDDKASASVVLFSGPWAAELNGSVAEIQKALEEQK
jgi:V8-like Glu-specific endopeptidase